MTDINVDLIVNTTSVEVTDASGEVLELTPQENVTVVVEESSGSGGGGSSDALEQFFGVQTIEGYEFMTEQEVYDLLEEIMTTMDGDLTAEMATNITAETQTIIH